MIRSRRRLPPARASTIVRENATAPARAASEDAVAQERVRGGGCFCDIESVRAGRRAKRRELRRHFRRHRLRAQRMRQRPEAGMPLEVEVHALVGFDEREDFARARAFAGARRVVR
jgi:hypothetical protein